MSQLTIYLDEDVAALMNTATKDAGVSKSQWIADAIRQRTKREWPASIAALSGTWKDFPTAEEIRAQAGADTDREAF